MFSSSLLTSFESFRSFFRFAGLLLLPGLLVGCGGGNTYTVDEGQLAQRFLPTERTVDYHPDSLKGLTITEEENKIQFQLEHDYESLMRTWSCSFQDVGAGRSLQTPTYATFWSLELSLASLQPEMGILTLRKERARQLLDERRKEYFQTIQIDVYWFVQRGEDGVIAGPGTRTRLHVQDSTYRPVRSDYGPLREAFLSGGSTALYRRNTLVFPRTVDGKDILATASGMRLEVHRMGAPSSERFTWRWDGYRTRHEREGAHVNRRTTTTRSPEE